LNTLNELASALCDDANYAATVQTQLSIKPDKATIHAKDQSYIQMGLRIDTNNAALSGQSAAIASLRGIQGALTAGTVVANANSGAMLSDTKTTGLQGLDGIAFGGAAEVLTLSGTSLAPKASPTFTGTLNADKVSIRGGLGSLAIETMGRIKTRGGNH
jgi:hypothetical protein